MESGKLTLNPVKFDPRCDFQAIADHAIFSARSKGLDCTFDVDQSMPGELWGDLLRLRQVLINILDNAVKFTDHGSVSINIRQIERSVEGSIVVRFTVKDTGIGLAEKQSLLIFEAFKQVADSRARLYGGTGLGLAISAEILELMDSRMQVSSEYGVGSTFIFDVKLPVFVEAYSDGKSATQTRDFVDKAAAPDSPATVATLSILLAEDNLVNQKVATLILEKCGHTVVVAETGESAVLLATENDFDLVLMDTGLLGIDGIEATRQIRVAERSGGRKPVPIVAITAHTLEGDRQRFLDAGMDECLPKPYEAKALRAVVSRMVV